MNQENNAIPAEENPIKAAEEELAAKIQVIEGELKECKDKYLRLLADGDNTRKRLQKEKQEMTKFAIENVIAEILGPIDNLENALKFTHQMSAETKTWATGFQMILGQFKDVLHNHGVSAFHSEGALFDPHLHYAIEVEETDLVPEGTILQEFVKGYKSGDRAIRPARVKVAKPINKQTQNEENKS
jgi:molecular chaperone GrpE